MASFALLQLDTSEATPQTNEHVELFASRCGGVQASALQGKDTYGFLPLHLFLPLADRTPVRSPGTNLFASSSCGSLRKMPAPLACMRWKVFNRFHEWDHRKAIARP
jgi:hypothetical protein